MKKLSFCKRTTVVSITYFLSLLFTANLFAGSNTSGKIIIDASSPYYINATTLTNVPAAGDTIFISSKRTTSIKFEGLQGNSEQPIVVINFDGQVKINDINHWGAITFENCKFIKITGNGHPDYKYGFNLGAGSCGLAFTELSSDCEAEFIKIDHDGFFGIYAKKDYGGFPPSPVPVFNNLSIHDCFIQNVTEGMYLGETKTPGMEFKNVKIYNNIVRNTGRESIQIANMVENVTINNNTLLNAGNDQLIYQNNILQIGDNSVAHVYNNILRGAPGFALISLGKGNTHYENNYFADAKGVFIDNRSVTDSNASIAVIGNYFKNITGYEVVKNMNEINPVKVAENFWDCEITFFKNASGNTENFVEENNVEQTIPVLNFTSPENSDYSLSENTSAEFIEMGAPGGPIYFGSENPEQTPQIISEQIILTSEMLVDEVAGGSYYSANYLVDEQNCTPENTLHPVSQSWKPYWNLNNAPYYVYIDLKHLYKITQINLHDMHNVANLEISFGEPGNWQTLFIEPCNSYNIWKIHDTAIETRFIRLSMNESVYAAVNELVIYGYALNDQIELKSTMISDDVTGGSYASPLYLIDEQTMAPESNMHPLSLSWKPYWNMDKAPYYTTIDLGRNYEINTIYLHDMHNVASLEIEYGSPGNWQHLATEYCNKFNIWKKHEIKVNTRYIRLAMLESVYAAVNEILLFGKPVNQPELKSASLISNSLKKETLTTFNSNRFYVYPNPVENILMINIPENQSYEFILEIFDASGRLNFSQKYSSPTANIIRINSSELNLQSGMHLIRLTDQMNQTNIFKFFKK